MESNLSAGCRLGHPIKDPLVLIQCFSHQGLVVVLTSGMRVIGLIGPSRLYSDIFGIAR